MSSFEIDPEDEQGFSSARGSLLGDFDRWLRNRAGLDPEAASETAGTAGLALDWKWQYADGDLVRWHADDVYEFLVEWCPRKLTMPQSECAVIPEALAALEFMNNRKLLGPGSADIALLRDVVEVVSDEFEDAMGDESKFGMAKTLMSAAAADGVGPDDPERMQDWIDEFNRRPLDERREMIPDRLFSPRKLSLPAVVVPADDEVAASRRQAPVLAKFAELAQFVGDKGRKLTAKGNLTLADARALVELLETGDVMDEKIGDRTFRTTSSDDLYVLRHLFAWAKKAGIVRVNHGRVVATKRGAALAAADDRAPFFDQVVDGLLGAGTLSSQRWTNSWRSWPDVDAFLDRSVPHLLAPPYGCGAPVDLDQIAAMAAAAVLGEFRFPRLSDEAVGGWISSDITDIFDALEMAGVVRRESALAPDDKWLSARRRRGGTVALTTAGVVTARRLLLEAGYDAPVAGKFADSSAAELFAGTDDHDFSLLRAELDGWLAKRGPVDAARELAAAVVELTDPALQSMALATMSELPASVSEPELRKLAAAPGAAPMARVFARCWLVDHGHDDESTLFDPDDLDSFVGVLAHRLVTRGGDAAVATLGLAGNHQEQIDLMSRLWRSPSLATTSVLDGLGRVHPTKAVAKAARKALFQRRSWVASSGRAQ